MNLSKFKPKSPILITIIAVLMLFGLTALPALLKTNPINTKLIYQVIYSIVMFISAISAVGLLMTKRWSVLLYSFNTLFSLTFSFIIGAWNPVSLLISATVLTIIASFYSQMD